MRIFFALALMLWSCTPKVLNSSTTTVKDSIVYTNRTIYDTVRVNRDDLLIDWLSTADTIVKHGRAELKISKQKVECICDSLTIAKKLAIHDTVHHIVRETAKVKTEIKFITSAFDKFTRWFFIACCCAVALYTGVKLAKI